MMNKFFILLFLCSCSFRPNQAEQIDPVKAQVTETLRKQIIKNADWALTQQPLTVTAYPAKRSAGGLHDFYSEGDYWWPDPANIDSPYVQRDGMTNPDNFTAHREAMIRFSRIVGALASAYIITGNEQYATQAISHCKAWFSDPATRMNPSLLFAQAIKGRATGRGIGIIDTIQLMEVVQGLLAMQHASVMDKDTWTSFQQWFAEYIKWLVTHPYGKAEMEAKNNHGTCWVMQVSVFAKFTGDEQMLEFCRNRFKTKLL
ncbi:MAG: alginate lyase, partial [Chitinophagaceae bacterium]